MKIQTTTERELSEDDYWLWAEATIESCKKADPDSPLNPASFQKLLEEKQISFSDDLGYTKATTTYKIID